MKIVKKVFAIKKRLFYCRDDLLILPMYAVMHFLIFTGNAIVFRPRTFPFRRSQNKLAFFVKHKRRRSKDVLSNRNIKKYRYSSIKSRQRVRVADNRRTLSHTQSVGTII